MKTEALVVRSLKGSWDLEQIEVVDECEATEVLIAIAASGFCHSDLSMQNGTLPGKFPAVLGHEGSGTILKVGSGVTRLKAGDKDSHRNLNLNMARKDGIPAFSGSKGESIRSTYLGQSSFSRHCLVDESSCILVPDTTTKEQLELLSVLGCSQITGAGAVLNVLKPPQGSTIAVFGVGAVGAAAIMAAALCPMAMIIAVDLKDNRLELAKKCGATHVINAGSCDAVQAIKDLTGGAGVNYSVECAGVVRVLEQAFNCLATAGTVAAIGVPGVGVKVPIDVLDLIRFGKHIVGVKEGDCNPQQLVPFLTHLNASGKYPFDILCKRYPFAEVDSAIAAMKDGSVIKPILVWDY